MRIWLLVPLLLQAQAFNPFPNGTAQYRFDLSRNFFVSPEAAAREETALLQRFEHLRSVGHSAR